MILRMERFGKKLFLIFGLSLQFACGWREHPVNQSEQAESANEQLKGANVQLLARDIELIESFIKRRGWDMQKTESGLFYSIYEQGEGTAAQFGDIISLDYTVSLLDGTICYSSDNYGPLVFTVGQGGVEAGLEQAVLMLRPGDKARLILPPFLAHGLLGDLNKIPPRAVIVYELEVLSVKKQNIP